MCETITRDGRECTRVSTWYVHVETKPQPLPNGEMETAPAGRSLLVCSSHLPRAVARLYSLPTRRYVSAPTVTPIKRSPHELARLKARKTLTRY